jgi:tetratricopeptide (TPR) repeat protein
LSSKKDKFLESAQKFILKGQLDRAIKDYEQVVILDPKDIRQRQRLAELLVRANRAIEAIGEYEAIGKYYSDNGFYLKAIAVYKQVQKLDPEDIKICLCLATLNEKQGLTGNALAEYGKVYSYYEKSGKLNDALKILESMVNIDPENLNTRLKFAETRYALGQKDDAYEDFSLVASLLKRRGDESVFAQIADRILYLFPDKKGQLDALNGASAPDEAMLAVPPPAADEAAVQEDTPQEPPVAEEEVPLSLAGEEDAVSLGIDRDTAATHVAAESADVEVGAGRVSVMADEPEYPLEVDLELEISEDELADMGSLYGEDAADAGSLRGGADVGEAAPVAGPAAEEGFVELTVDSLFEPETALVEMSGSAAGPDTYKPNGLFSGVKKGLEQQLDQGDTETRYNLGIAFKEMGLYDEAMTEFEAAAADPKRRIDCLTLQGVCCRDKGDFARAEALFRDGIALEGLSEEELLSITYELALLHEITGRTEEALAGYRQIEARQHDFRGTREKIARLQGGEDLDELELVELAHDDLV